MQRKGTVNGIINALRLMFLRELGAHVEKEPLLGYDDSLQKGVRLDMFSEIRVRSVTWASTLQAIAAGGRPLE